ncbi:hypothetical protein ACWWD9_09935 [Methylovorus sp. SPW-M1]
MSTPPSASEENECAVYTEAMMRDVMRAPLAGYKLVAYTSKSALVPEKYVQADPDVATVSDTLWRNPENGFCLYGTHVQLKNITLKNGKSFELNDVVRGGFAGKSVEAAYFFSNHPRAARETEVVFRIGRTFTSVRHMPGDSALPKLPSKANEKPIAIHDHEAAVNDNWVDFTTDVNPQDPDGTSYPYTSTLYVKAECATAEPREYEGAIRLRSTGQGQDAIEISLPGYAPPGAIISQ